MTQEDALKCISNGHTEWSVEAAQEIVRAFGITELPDRLIDRWAGQADANPTNDYKGLWLEKDEAGTGVNSLRLSDFIVDYFKLEVRSFHGRGSQAQANSEVVKKHLAL